MKARKTELESYLEKVIDGENRIYLIEERLDKSKFYKKAEKAKNEAFKALKKILPEGEATKLLYRLDEAYTYQRALYGDEMFKYGFLDGNVHDCFLRQEGV